ncbi:MAG: ABC transporter permease subunit [Anaerolineae bacterium]|nr:ABC transporter permease subunit [Anaerolineae bacterium]
MGLFALKSRQRFAPWLGLVPFLAFCLAFEIIPIIVLVRGSISDSDGVLTFANYQRVSAPLYVRSLWNSIQLSAITASLGTLLGLFIGYAIFNWPSERFRESLIALSDVTTNFAGAPLAFAFIVILGSNGVITLLFERQLGLELYPAFSIYSYSGLVLAYVYFQLPLMVLLIIPAFAGLRREWRESALNLGASTRQYWRRIGMPLLLPSLLSGFILLFANAFGAYATAYTLAGSRLSLVTLQIGFSVTGEVRHEPGVGDALAVVSLITMGMCVLAYQLLNLRMRSEMR